MKNSIHEMLAYNLWANQQISAWLRKLDNKFHHEKVANSFESISATVHHIFKAETGWFNKMTAFEGNVFPVYCEKESKETQLEKLLKQSVVLVNYGSNLEEYQWLGKIHYSDGKTDYFPTRHQILQHVCNHSTYHRGQLTSMAHQLEIEPRPATDFIKYLRQFKQDAGNI